MLDTDTKRRIDTARDILVGKVPDPNSQVEQITIALIYKFMDDMDKESIGYGGEPSFFTGDFEQFGWSRIFDPTLSGIDTLNLYSEAIVKLNENSKIPQLFRNIFKNAYLPYRDPETLKLFLKTINEFTYDHSEKLGDAFEYLLSVLGSQGDAGQFRTPRHIIDFMVAVMQPKKHESILDPACGTAGFLISSYKHIVAENTKKINGDLLTPDDRKRITENFAGYDISPDMVRLSLVNLYLHNFTAPNIHEYDTLTTDTRWGDYFDIILANPPFMTPKGGIKPHKRFTVQANRSEVLFVDYIAEHIHPTTGRAAIIVPEGIIFQSAGAYKSLRKMLVSDYLYAVVSLPAGIFQPYSGVKTSILFLDKQLAKKTDKILFVKVDNDGFSLGAQRRENNKSDLPLALEIFNKFKESILIGDPFSKILSEELKDITAIVEKENILANRDVVLNVERYLESKFRQTDFELVKINELCSLVRGSSPRPQGDPKYFGGNTPRLMIADVTRDGMYTTPKIDFLTDEGALKSRPMKKGEVIMAVSGNPGLMTILSVDACIHDGFVGFRELSDRVIPEYLFYVLSHIKDENNSKAEGAVFRNLTTDQIRDFEIPLPPLEIQQQIVTKIESYQKIIDGARQVVENYKPQIDIDPEWEMVELKSVCEHITKGSTPTTYGFKFQKSGISFVKIESITDDGDIDEDELSFIDEKCQDNFKRSQLKENDVLFSIAGTNMGITGIVHNDILPANTNQALCIIRPLEKLLPKFVFYYLRSYTIQNEIEKLKKGVAQFNLSLQQVSDLSIPLPPVKIQETIVNQIENEKKLINANKELIKLYEQKIKDEINKLWQEKGVNEIVN